MNCTTCKFAKPDECIKSCLQIYFKHNSEANPHPVRVHKSEVAGIELSPKFLIITDIDGTKHHYNCDIISHFHVPNFK